MSADLAKKVWKGTSADGLALSLLLEIATKADDGGELTTTRKRLADALGVSTSTIEGGLTYLRNRGHLSFSEVDIRLIHLKVMP